MGIVVTEDCKFIMKNTDIKGNKNKDTIGNQKLWGIIAKWADLDIQRSKIHQH